MITLVPARARAGIRLALPVTAMARSAPGRLWLVAVTVALGLAAYVPGLRALRLPVRIPTGQTLWIADLSELRVLIQVFVNGEYDVAALPARATRILDLGANVGIASAFFAARYPAARIVAYEADPTVARRARRHLRRLNVEVRDCAISDRRGQLVLRRSPRESWATSEFASAGEQFAAPAVGLDDVIGDAPVDILKLDIEGSEYAAIRSCRRLDLVDLILGEFHPTAGVTAENFFALLDGFEVVFASGDPYVEFVAVRRPRRGEAASADGPAPADGPSAVG